MGLLRVRVHPRGLGLQAQRKVSQLRQNGLKGKKMSWAKISMQVRNLEGKVPCWKVCRDVYNRANRRTATASYDYSNCGRQPTMTPALRKWVVRRLLVLRKVKECTSTTLQAELAKWKHVKVEASTVRKALKLEGYRWLSRSKKPKYNAEQRAERLSFSEDIEDYTQDEIQEVFNLSLDGVVFTKPPTEAVARQNFCFTDLSMCWRKPSEGTITALDGHDRYKNQVPPSRMIPLWGGLGSGGFAPILWHQDRKTNTEEWVDDAIKSGSLQKALRAVNPGKVRGPWVILCDNESFLRAKPCMALYRRLNIKLLKLPAKSPDLNPVEKMWGWARKQLRAMDLADLAARRPVLGKTAYTERIKRLLKSPRAQRVAQNFAKNLITVAKRVVKAKGAAVRG